jgi:hypothetical protein
MVVMAEKPKGKRGRPAGRREAVPIQLRIPPELFEALKQLIGGTRRSKNAEMMLALEKHLADHGLWQRPADPSQGGPR